MKTTIRNYETLYVVDPTLTDEQVEAIITKYSSVIADQGGEVKAAGKWDKRRLAYEIKGRREGIYILMFFDGEPAAAKELDRVFRIADDVMRHIITRVELQHVDTTRIERPQPTAAVEPAPRKAAEAVEAAEETVAVEEAPQPVPEPEEPAAKEPVTEEAAPEEAVEETVEESAQEPAEAQEEVQIEVTTEETESQGEKAEE